MGVCPDGLELNETGSCILCERGSYRNNTEDRFGSCKPCPQPFNYTDAAGATNSNLCIIPQCDVGFYIGCSDCTQPPCLDVCGSRLECVPCRLDSFSSVTNPYSYTTCQDCQEQFPSSAIKYGTEEVGSSSRNQCLGHCGEAGYELNSNNICQLCSVGTYKTAEDRFGNCTQCPENFKTDNFGATDISKCNIPLCSAGQYLGCDTCNTPPCVETCGSALTCVDCPLHTFQETPMVMSSTQCTNCSSVYSVTIPGAAGLGTTQTGTTSRSQCKEYCRAGLELSSTGSVCIACNRGFYKDNSDVFSNCIQCPNNAYTTNQQGATSSADCNILKCNTGQVVSCSCPEGCDGCTLASQCEECPVNTYQPFDNPNINVVCQECPANTGTRNNGTANREDCESICVAGFEKDAIGNCVPCARGYYKDNVIVNQFDMCAKCEVNTTTDSIGSTSPADCKYPVCKEGEEILESNNVYECRACPIDTIQTAVVPRLSDTCTPCPNGSGTNQTGSKVCIEFCVAGYENHPDCTPCARGFYRENEGLARFGNCVACPPNRTTDGMASSSEADCTFPVCSKGQFINGTICTDCPLDTYQPIETPFSTTTCQSCEDNTGTKQIASTDKSQCESYCESGQELVSDDCRACPRGSYKDNSLSLTTTRFGSCIPCNTNGFTTNNNGSKFLSDCNVRVCSAGQIINQTSQQCIDCPVDTYQPDVLPTLQTQCVACSPGSGTVQIGSQNSSDCLVICGAGYFYNDSTSQCEICPQKTYKISDQKFGSCQLCPTLYTTEGTGAVSELNCTIRDCPAGTFISGDNCIPCPLGTYQDLHLQTECKSCGEDKNTSLTGSTSEDNCTLYCGAGQSGGIHGCSPCPEGTFKQSAGFGACQDCSVNTRPNDQKTDCEVYCGPGLYNAEGSQCLPCPERQYKNISGNTGCIDCPDGFTTNGAGQTECSELFCVPGQYLLDGMCKDCPIGNYKSTHGNDPCTACSVNTTANTGATSQELCNIVVCNAGFYRDVNSNTCLMCGVNTYQDETGQTFCKLCPDDTVTLGPGAQSITMCKDECLVGSQYDLVLDVCQLCDLGTYKDTVGNIDQCQPCPTGKTTLNKGTVSLNDCSIDICQPGSFRPAGSSTCQLCGLGEYQPDSDKTSCIQCPQGQTNDRVGETDPNNCRVECGATSEWNTYLQICEICEQGIEYKPDGSRDCQICPNGTASLFSGAHFCIDTGIYQEISTVRLTFGMSYQVTDCFPGNKQIILSQVSQATGTRLNELSTGYTNCNGSPCFTVYSVTSDSTVCESKRRKRSTETVVVNVAVDSLALLTDGDGVSRKAEKILQNDLVLNKDQYTPVVDQIVYQGLASPVTSQTLCQAGQQINANTEQCDTCPAGTYNPSALGTCSNCELGTYQNLTGQTSCVPCPQPNIFTLNTGTTREDLCISQCDVDPGYCNYRGTCTPTRNTATCTCQTSYNGDRCDNKITGDEDSDRNIVIFSAVGGIVGLLIVAIVVIVLCCACRIRNGDKSSISEDSDMYKRPYVAPRYNPAFFGTYSSQSAAAAAGYMINPAFQTLPQQSVYDNASRIEPVAHLNSQHSGDNRDEYMWSTENV